MPAERRAKRSEVCDDDMQLDETYQQANSQFEDLLFNGKILNKAALGILCCLCLFLLFFALSKRLKGQWSSTFFIFLCACIFIWGWCSLLADIMLPGSRIEHILFSLRNIGIIPIPILLYIHAKQQVSYRELHFVPVILVFIPPAFFVLMILRDLFLPRFLDVIPVLDETLWLRLIFYAYTVTFLIWAYLQCFTVFFQMPKHMRRSTKYMILGISSFSLLLSLDVLWNNTISEMVPYSRATDILIPLAATLSFYFLVYPLYSAMRLMPAEDVIVTSREFVMGGLSTTILVLGRRMQILDWNRKDWDDGYPLPKPLYKEPMEVYRRRIVEQSPFRASPHDNNIITAVSGGDEIHFLMHTREVQNKKRRFGYILEISEITRVYTMLRLFEEIAHFDQLTKLHNRNAYLDYVQNSIIEENMPMLIFVGDVNGLKQLNDNNGHILGDQLLRMVADIIQLAAPQDAFTARVGGDEYVMLVPRGTDDIADKFVRDMISMCSDTHHEVIGSPSISWGYAIMKSTEQSYNEVFEAADAMMYAYKKGRNQFTSSGLMPD